MPIVYSKAINLETNYFIGGNSSIDAANTTLQPLMWLTSLSLFKSPAPDPEVTTHCSLIPSSCSHNPYFGGQPSRQLNSYFPVPFRSMCSYVMVLAQETWWKTEFWRFYFADTRRQMKLAQLLTFLVLLWKYMENICDIWNINIYFMTMR